MVNTRLSRSVYTLLFGMLVCFLTEGSCHAERSIDRKVEKVKFHHLESVAETLRTYPFLQDFIKQSNVNQSQISYIEIVKVNNKFLKKPLLFVSINGDAEEICDNAGCLFGVYSISNGGGYKKVSWGIERNTDRTIDGNIERGVDRNGSSLFTSECPGKFSIVLTGPGVKTADMLWDYNGDTFMYIGGYPNLSSLPPCKVNK